MIIEKKEEWIKEVMFWVEDWTHHPYIGQSFSRPNAPTLLHMDGGVDTLDKSHRLVIK